MTPSDPVGRRCPTRRAALAAASFAALAATAIPAQADAAPLHDQIVAAAGAGSGWPADRVPYDTPGDGRLWACGATWKASFGVDGRHLSFAADSEPVRDVDVELAVATDLAARPEPSGLRFAGSHGEIAYDGAFVQRGADRLPIEVTSQFAAHPRTADLDVADAFLIAFEITDPGRAGENYAPEVGGDPGTDPSSLHNWLVVWTNIVSTADANVHARVVTAGGLPNGGVMRIEDGVGTCNANVQVSRSNGKGVVPYPMWFVVYSRYQANNAVDVFGRTVPPDFLVGPEITIDNLGQRNLYPQVSSPIASGNRTAFLVTFERPNPASAQAVVARSNPGWWSSARHDLTAAFGMVGAWLRAESDGVRFVTTSLGQTPGQLEARTFAAGSNLVLLDGPCFMAGGSQPEIAACRSSGGAIGAYGFTWLHDSGAGSVLQFSRYRGTRSATPTQVLPTKCHGLDIRFAGSPLLGDAMQFALPSLGADLPGFAFGSPAGRPIPICTGCSLGLRLDQPIAIDQGTATFDARIPPASSLVGLSFAVQGLGPGPWSCLGALRVSDTVSCTIL